MALLNYLHMLICYDGIDNIIILAPVMFNKSCLNLHAWVMYVINSSVIETRYIELKLSDIYLM